MNESDQKQVGLESLQYHRSKVSWAISKHISQENPLLHRLLVYIILSIMALTIFYSLVTKVAISIMGNGKLDFEKNALSVINATDIVVDKIYVKDGEPIKTNDLLITGKRQISSDQAKALLKQSDTVLEQINLERTKQCHSTCIQKLEGVYNNGLSKMHNLEIEGELIDYLKQLSSDLNAYLLALKNIKVEPQTLQGLQLRFTQATKKLQQIKVQRAENLLAMEVENLNKEIMEIKSQISEKKLSSSNQIANVRSTLQLNLKPLREKLITYRKNHEIRSPGVGILKYEALGGEGEFLSARSKIFQIIPTQENLVAKILVQNKDISEIRLEDKVKIAIQAIPEREFGSVYGIIKKISVNPIENKNNNTLDYEIIVTLEKQSLRSSFGDERSFKLGMLVEGKIITRHRTLFKVGLSKLLNIKDEYLGDLF